MTNDRIPVYQPDLSGNEKRYVMECLDSSWISSRGRFIGEFEDKFSAFTGVKHAVAVCNGTVALHLALASLDIGPGDEVIVPTLTYVAAANAVVYTGAKPVFVDSLRDTWQIDPDDVRRKITPRTKAIMAVHLYGHPCEMDRLTAIAKEHDIFLVEDCAEAFGAVYKGRHVGGFGDIGIFSFFGNKTITTGEGGMVVTNDAALAARARHLKSQAVSPQREYWHDAVGFNYRMTNICAAIGLAQLERANELIGKKRLLAERYRKEFAGLPVEFHKECGDVVHGYWMISILAREAAERDPLRTHLKERGIETRPVFYPAHTMPVYKSFGGSHPTAEAIASRGMNLPSWPGLSGEQVGRIRAAIAEFYEGK